MAKVLRPVKPLASVNVMRSQDNGYYEIEVCCLKRPEALVRDEAEATRAVLALDVSRSMVANYGDALWGERNVVEAYSRKMGEYFAHGWSTDNKAHVIYWAAGTGGAEIFPVGDFHVDECMQATITGPPQNRWGTGTKLLPVLQYFEKLRADADRLLAVVITDGIIEDEKQCMEHCLKLGEKLVSNGRPDSLKLVLVGVGPEVDREQLDRFDNMFEATPLKGEIDLWSSGVARDWKEEHHVLGAVFGELMSEDMILGNGRCAVLDGNANEIRSWTDGLPGKFRFELPKEHRSFAIEIEGQEIVQDITEALATEPVSS